MNSKELVKQAVRFQGPERLPVSYPYDWKKSDLVNVDVIQHYMGQSKTHSEWGFVWSHLDNNLTMGQPRETIIKTWENLKDYQPPDPYRTDRFDMMKQTRSEFGEDKNCKANLGLSGFTTMCFLRGFSETLEDMCLEREFIEALADKVFGFEEQLIQLLRPNGFDAVGLADDWATQQNLFISPQLWREIFKPRYKRQVELAHQCGLDLYFHSCGYIFDLIPDFIEIGVDILNPGQPNINNIPRMGEHFSGKICFACPVSYQTTGISGTKEDIYREAKELADCLGNHRGGPHWTRSNESYWSGCKA